jgi:hypothetical protein
MDTFKRWSMNLAQRKWLVITGLFLLVAAITTVSVKNTPGSGQPLAARPQSGQPSAATPSGAAGTACGPLLPRETPPIGTGYEFKTDFSTHCVHYSEILYGGVTKDGIPAIDHPQFVGVVAADGFLRPGEPVIVFQVADDVRAYPIQILIWHEIVNDVVGGVPVAVTYCPLCNTGIVFERTINGRTLDFGVSGRLRFSNQIMYDRQTESWWQQETGQAIVGTLTGLQLTYRPAEMISWATFKAAHPKGRVLSQNTGYSRPYGTNPYSGYDSGTSLPPLYQGTPPPNTLPPMERVLAVAVNGQVVAYPYSVLQQVHVVNDMVGGTDVVVFWVPGTNSPLDASAVASGRDVGSATLFSRAENGQTLTFTYGGSGFVDAQTSSTWNALGHATGGPLAGQALTPVAAFDSFWFSWAAFQPHTRVYHP